MKSTSRGKNTSAVEVGNVTASGFWLLLDNRELFLSFEKFPWFKDAPIGKLLHVMLPHAGHLYWPDLDVDLAVESIEHPERYPLVSRGGVTIRETSSKAKKPRNRNAETRRKTT